LRAHGAGAGEESGGGSVDEKISGKLAIREMILTPRVRLVRNDNSDSDPLVAAWRMLLARPQAILAKRRC